jgi:hypothetical protein
MATDGFLPLTQMQSELVWPFRRPQALHLATGDSLAAPSTNEV